MPFAFAFLLQITKYLSEKELLQKKELFHVNSWQIKSQVIIRFAIAIDDFLFISLLHIETDERQDFEQLLLLRAFQFVFLVAFSCQQLH